MTHSMADAGKRMMAAMAAVITACILVMGCATPAYAKQDPGWGQETYTGQDQNAQSTDTNNSQGEGNVQGTGTDADSTGTDSGNRDGSDSGNDGNGNDNGGNNDAILSALSTAWTYFPENTKCMKTIFEFWKTYAIRYCKANHFQSQIY